MTRCVRASSLDTIFSGCWPLRRGIMFALSFIVRRNDPKAGGEVAVG